MPARGTATNRGLAVDRALASGRATASGRLNVDGSGGGAADDMTFLDEVIVGGGGAATIAFSSISGSYRQLGIFWTLRGDTAAAVTALYMQFNGDAAGNYDIQAIDLLSTTYAAGPNAATANAQIGAFPAASAPAGMFGSGTIWIPYYDTTTQNKMGLGHSGSVESTAASGQRIEVNFSSWRTTNAAITSITLLPQAGNFVENSRAALYGLT